MSRSGTRESIVERAVSEFGAALRTKLTAGGGEEQLKTPTEMLLTRTGRELGLEPVVCIGELGLPAHGVRPDMRVDIGAGLVGYIELKHPDKSIDPEEFSRQDAKQYGKLMLLPNVLYHNGRNWRLYRHGVLARSASLNLPVRTAGGRLAPTGPEFAALITDFLTAEPTPSRDIAGLVRAIARACQLLRVDVAEAMANDPSTAAAPFGRLVELATEWRGLLFPEATDADFADQYAQTVAFALLLARMEGITFEGTTLHDIAVRLGKKSSLIGKALEVLTDDAVLKLGLSVAVDTLTTVIGSANWSELGDGSGNAYLELYERFLKEYDPALRRTTGSYYTPHQVVTPMVTLVDEILRTRLGYTRGFADPQVAVIDPAMGTGTFLLKVVDSVVDSVTADEGPGSVAPTVRDLVTKRLYGFEMQTGPFAVAQLRVFESLKGIGVDVTDESLHLMLADTLDDPEGQDQQFGSWYEPMARSRREAARVKSDVRIQVVLGNPPYGERPHNERNWIVARNRRTLRTPVPPIEAFRIRGNGALDRKLANSYIDFWRWATWKVFDAHAKDPGGIVAFVSLAGYCTGDAFAGVRRYLRGAADEGWIIDLTPEGRQAPVPTRIFPEVQQPLCIGVFVRSAQPSPAVPAVIHYRALAGTQGDKFAGLAELSVNDRGWQDVPSDWEAPFRPAADAAWTSHPLFSDLMPWSEPGLKTNRSWVIAPSRDVLRARWGRLVSAPPGDRDNLMKATRDRNSLTRFGPARNRRGVALAQEDSPCPRLKPLAFRSFDRQWLINDNRLIDFPRGALRAVDEADQVFATEAHTERISGGPALTFSALLPDMHHYNGRGGRVVPLYRSPADRVPNVTPELLPAMSQWVGNPISAEDLLSYVAALVAHPSYTERFSSELQNPGVRVPLTMDPALWGEAVSIGRQVLRLHTFGERFGDAAPGGAQSSGSPRTGLASAFRPKHVVMISDQPDEMPKRIEYDEDSETLHVGGGAIAPVPKAVMAYQVSGMRVVAHWFGYRKAKPAGRRSTPLDDIVAVRWTPEYTTELLDLLGVLGGLVALEPSQARLLDRVLDGPLASVGSLEAEGVLPVPNLAQASPDGRGEALF